MSTAAENQLKQIGTIGTDLFNQANVAPGAVTERQQAELGDLHTQSLSTWDEFYRSLGISKAAGHPEQLVNANLSQLAAQWSMDDVRGALKSLGIAERADLDVLKQETANNNLMTEEIGSIAALLILLI